MTSAEAKILSETHANVKTLMAMHTECHRERVANTDAIKGNGTPGLQRDVAVLKHCSEEMQSDTRWLWRFVVATAAVTSLSAVAWLFQHFIVGN